MSKDVLAFATLDPKTLSGAKPTQLYNLVGGKWTLPRESSDIPDPLNGEIFLKMPNTRSDEIQPFLDSLASCPKSGLHNPLKNVERYRMYGDISAKAAGSDPSARSGGLFCTLRSTCDAQKLRPSDGRSDGGAFVSRKIFRAIRCDFWRVDLVIPAIISANRATATVGRTAL